MEYSLSRSYYIYEERFAGNHSNCWQKNPPLKDSYNFQWDSRYTIRLRTNRDQYCSQYKECPFETASDQYQKA